MTTAAWEDFPALDPGDDFEQRFWGLLRRRYRPEELFYFPADMGGDKGIEGYSTDGIAYQCYADRDSVTLRHRTDKQKGKLYDDSLKLRTYSKDLQKLLCGRKIKHYFLVVPQYHAAELVAYANDRAKAVRDWGLPFIASGFRVNIKKPQDYPAELAAALSEGKHQALLPEPVIEAGDIEQFPERRPELLSNLEGKLDVLGQRADLRSFRDSLVRSFLIKEQLMQGLEDWPETRESVERRRRLFQDGLEWDNELDTSDPRTRLRGVLSSYAADLTRCVGSLRDPDVQRLSQGQIAEWLMRCPLRLKAGEG